MAPDVAHIKAEWLPQLLALGVVKPLDGYISADVLADYSQSAIDSVTVDGSMMALPWFSNTCALLVNTDLCEQAGVDYTAISFLGRPAGGCREDLRSGQRHLRSGDPRLQRR